MAQPQWKRTKLGYANPTHLISQAPSTANILCLSPSQVLPKLPRDPCSPTTHTHVYAHMHALTCARAHMHIHTCACPHTTDTRASTHTHARLHMCTHICPHMCGSCPQLLARRVLSASGTGEGGFCLLKAREGKKGEKRTRKMSQYENPLVCLLLRQRKPNPRLECQGPFRRIEGKFIQITRLPWSVL